MGFDPKAGGRITWMATFAATNPSPVPNNVRSITNYYFKTNGGSRPVSRGRGMRGSLRNIDLSRSKGINHFNIDENPKLQRRVMRRILRIMGRR